MKKETLIRVLAGLPEEFELEMLIERLLFVQQVKEGREDLKDGRSVSLEELEAEFEVRWRDEG